MGGSTISILISLVGLFFMWYLYEKNNLINYIKSIVKSCREQDALDNRSKYKFFSWLEGEEDELHRKSLWKLKHIKKEMWRYLEIHIRMDLDTDQNGKNVEF